MLRKCLIFYSYRNYTTALNIGVVDISGEQTTINIVYENTVTSTGFQKAIVPYDWTNVVAIGNISTSITGSFAPDAIFVYSGYLLDNNTAVFSSLQCVLSRSLSGAFVPFYQNEQQVIFCPYPTLYQTFNYAASQITQSSRFPSPVEVNQFTFSVTTPAGSSYMYAHLSAQNSAFGTLALSDFSIAVTAATPYQVVIQKGSIAPYVVGNIIYAFSDNLVDNFISYLGALVQFDVGTATPGTAFASYNKVLNALTTV